MNTTSYLLLPQRLQIQSGQLGTSTLPKLLASILSEELIFLSLASSELSINIALSFSERLSG